MIQRITRSAYHHPWRTLSLWLAGLAALLVVAGALGDRFSDGGRLRGTDSDHAYQLLARDLPASGANTANIVIRDPNGPGSPTVTAFVNTVKGLTRGGAVTGPIVATDGRTEIFTVDMPDHKLVTADGQHVDQLVAHDLERAAGPPRAAGLQVELSGFWFQQGDVPGYTEAVGIAVAVVVLLFVFGSLLAVGVTLLPALLAVVASGAVVTLVTRLISTPDVTTTVATMIGLGVGIDYSLFIITRFRRELARRAPLDALRVAMGTAGRAVALAGGTVAISLLGMLLVGLDFLHGLSIGAAIAVGVAVLSSMTLLPALLRWSTTSMTRKAHADAARAGHETMWHRWGRTIARRPVVALVGGLVVLLALAAPVLSMRLASADAGNDPKGSTTRAAYDLTAAAFGPGINGPLIIAVADAPPTALAGLRARLTTTPGVAAVEEAVLSPNRRTAAITVVPATAPQSAATEALVRRLRHDVIPASGVTAYVGGATASNIDFSDVLRHRLPVFIGGVLACSFLLLLLVFRSILVPLKAVLLNLLSISAAFGTTVAVFQWGWFAHLIGAGGGAPIEPWAPMLLFAIVFGLSMDYEVFLLSAVKEHYDAHGDNREAVVEGLSSTARVITAAAAIMVAVFASFVTADLRSVQLVGFGLAVAVLIDATVVRMILVPASMELLGDRNWWLPRAIDARLPHVRIDVTPDEPDTLGRPEPLAPAPAPVPAYARSES